MIVESRNQKIIWHTHRHVRSYNVIIRYGNSVFIGRYSKEIKKWVSTPDDWAFEHQSSVYWCDIPEILKENLLKPDFDPWL